MHRKEMEKQISLHLNVLSRMATGRDVDVTVVDDGKGTFCNVGNGKIQIEQCSDDIEILIGLGFHELGHALATSSIDYAKEYGVPEEDVKLLHNQMNSLEDYRVERKISQLYPSAEYYLRKMSRWWRLEGSKKRMIGEMTHNPQFPLHLLLDNIDLLRFVEKPTRQEIRKLCAELKAAKFEDYPSTRSIFPLAKDAYYRLKPFMPKHLTEEAKQEMAAQMPVVACMGGTGGDEGAGKTREGKPVLEEIDDNGITSGSEPTDKKGSGIPALDFQNAIDKEANQKNNEVSELKRGGKPPSVRRQENYVRPYEPKVKKITEVSDDDWGESGITDEQYCADQGRLIGRKLMQELKFKEGARHRLDEGELDIGDMIENMQENKGKLGSLDVFSDETPLIHDHTVCVMIDMSGSMAGDDIKNARAAALMLGKALEEMNIFYSIRGFGAKQGELEIHDLVVKDFDEPLDIMKLRRMFMDNVNRDTDSIRHVMKLMAAERGKKIIFVISDGQPNHPDGTGDYRNYNNNAFMDMWFLTREAEKEGISIIGIGITAEAATFISETYLKGFFVKNIQELPERLTKIYLKETESLRPVWRNMSL